jgi:hypothetical protein
MKLKSLSAYSFSRFRLRMLRVLLLSCGILSLVADFGTRLVTNTIAAIAGLDAIS